MNKLKSHFRFNKQERSGIFFLLLIIVLLQAGYFAFKFFPSDKRAQTLSVDTELQAKIDILKERALLKDTVRIYPFNPNFITDYKGYALGMSVEEIDRLHAFRSQNKFANSPEEFQSVTGVSDTLLKAISPYFKFPEWTTSSKQLPVSGKQYKFREGPNKLDSSPPASEGHKQEEVAGLAKGDLNTATADDLKKIYGIGDKLSARIIKFRNRLGGFIIDEQLYDVYGLKPETAKRTLSRYRVLTKPEIKKININMATEEELSELVYINFETAQNIVEYRNKNGSFDSFDELRNIEGFPSDKIDRIALYLSKN